MKSATILAMAMMLSACGTGGSVYDDPLPKSNDMEAINKIKEGIKPEDADAWQNIAMMIVMPVAKRPTAKTVGEAIKNYKSREACRDEHDFTKVGDSPSDIGAPDYDERQRVYTERYNKEVDAYNACQKMAL